MHSENSCVRQEWRLQNTYSTPVGGRYGRLSSSGSAAHQEHRVAAPQRKLDAVSRRHEERTERSLDFHLRLEDFTDPKEDFRDPVSCSGCP